jgi:TRAP-type C4-dicarboxylate transport system substrate-binding protein
MKTPKDVAGQKIRTSVTEIYVETLKAWGCNPTPINWVEVYTALQQKTVDGLTTPSLLAYYQKFYEVQKYMSVVNFNPFPHYPLMNKAWYDGLPDDVKKVFDNCREDYLKKTRELHQGMESEALVLLEKTGMQLIRFDKESIKPWKDAVRKVWDSQVDFAGKEILEEVKAFLGKA